MQPIDFSTLFDDGREIDTEQGRVRLTRQVVGDLVVPTGRIVACDPFTAPDTEAFAVTLAPGTYPVVVSVAHFADGDQRTAGAMLQINSRKPATWRMALQPDQDLAELGDDEIFGYSVDSAVGCFMDADAAEELMTRMEEDEDYFETILARMDKTYVDTWSWANIEMNPATGANLIAFSSGMGDDFYASYFGLDEAGEIVCLVTDFALFDAEEMTR